MNASSDKPCPFCGELIKATAVKCRFCGEFLQTPVGGRLHEAEHARQTPLGHAVAADTQVLFEGRVSRITLVGPSVGVVAWLVVGILVGTAGSWANVPGDATVVAGIAASIGLFAILYWVYKWLEWKHRVFRITNDRVELEQGIFSRSLHNLDLWRVQDLAFNQSLIQRVFGLGRVLILSSDKDTPALTVGPIYHARELYNQLKRAQLEADRRRGVVHLEQ